MNFDKLSDVDNSNINFLLNSNKLNNLRVNDDGRIVKKNLWQLIHYSIDSNYSKKEDCKLNKAITNIVKDIESMIDKNEKISKDVINKLLFEKLSTLGENIFNRKELLKSKALQNYLNPSLRHLREEKYLNPELKDNELHKIARKMEKARLTIKLGAGKKSADKGTTGTLILNSVTGKPLGVFKLERPAISFTQKCLNILRYLGGQLHYLSPKVEAGAQAETAAYILNRHLKFGLVSPTHMTEIEGQRGSFQLFLKDYKEAKLEIANFDKNREWGQNELTIFQKMALFDYLIGNLDRHEENWFVKVIPSSGSKTQLVDIKLIDNANSFLKKNISFFKPIDSNQFAWKKLNMARIPFTQDTINFIQSLKEENLDAFIEELSGQIPDFLDQDMEQLLRQRFHVILQVVKQSGTTPFDLTHYVTDKEIEQIITR